MIIRSVAIAVASGFVFAAPALAQDGAAEAPALTAKQAQTVDRLIDRGLEDERVYAILESLTTEIGPRPAGTAAEARAREWGVATFKELGFKNVRIETFEMPIWSRIAESAEIVAPFPQPLIINALGQSPSTPEGGVEAEVVLFRTLPELQAAPVEGLQGKIIFIDEPMARTQDGSGYGTAVAKRSLGAVEAAKRGAAAVLIRSAGTDSHRFPHTGGSVRGGRMLAPAPAAALSNPDADQLARVIERASEPVIIKLNIQTSWNEGAVSGNVIGEIPGKTDELILIGGHLDSWDTAPGAIDDASGVAITAAAAKLIDELPGKPTRTIRVIMWGAEEVGLFGARAYAAQHQDELDRHILASESDFGAGKIWRFDTNFGEAALPKAQPMADALRRLAIVRGNNRGGGGPDTIPLQQAGVPVARLYQNGWDYFDYHHTPDDTLDKIDPESIRQNVAAWAAFVYMASEMDGDFR